MFQRRTSSPFLLCFSLSALLSACGGGGSAAGPAVPISAPVPSPTPTIFTMPQLAAATSVSVTYAFPFQTSITYGATVSFTLVPIGNGPTLPYGLAMYDAPNNPSTNPAIRTLPSQVTALGGVGGTIENGIQYSLTYGASTQSQFQLVRGTNYDLYVGYIDQSNGNESPILFLVTTKSP